MESEANIPPLGSRKQCGLDIEGEGAIQEQKPGPEEETRATEVTSASSRTQVRQRIQKIERKAVGSPGKNSCVETVKAEPVLWKKVFKG